MAPINQVLAPIMALMARFGTIAEQYENIQGLVLAEIRKDKRISVKQLSRMFNKTRASMFRIIEKLKDDGKLRRVGSLKSGTCEVIE